MRSGCCVFVMLLSLLVAGCGDSEPTSSGSGSGGAVAAGSGAVEGTAGAGAAVEYVRPPLTDEEISAGWISLFDQRSLFGWDVPSVSNWRVEDGVIVVDAGEKSLLMTPFELDDFELRCERTIP